MIKFIHCSDIHLGANPYGIEERFEDMGKAFLQVVRHAIDEKVDFVVIAGDFFHKKNLNAKTLEQAVDLLEPLKNAGIPVYVTEGNHDMATYTNVYSWLDFLSQKGYVYLLKPDVLDDGSIGLTTWHDDIKKGSIIEKEDFFIVGLGYPGATASTMVERLSKQIPENTKKPIITLLHSGIDKFVTEGMGGLREEELEPVIGKSDYIALGHIHNRYENKEKKYFNPGSIENVKVESLSRRKENNDKGFYIVNIDKLKEIKIEFKIISIRNTFSIEIDLMGYKNNIEDIKNKILSEIQEKNICSDEAIILNIKLIGTLEDKSTMLDINDIKNDIKSNLNVIYLEILNMLTSNQENVFNVNEAQNRDEVDKEVISKLILDEGFGENDVLKLLPIILKTKELASEGQLTIDKQEGIDITSLIEKYIINEA
ncbi:MAG: hypothetical protein A2Y24_00745 [Clostridiales bacterium GWE2_32_10]|nr:MAG: hypothetical protein A2Y24_00745 [Clostridiales bacterium GWE2_32_10]HBY20155.1 hypothetical protein [Clostridiales bacterium]